MNIRQKAISQIVKSQQKGFINLCNYVSYYKIKKSTIETVKDWPLVKLLDYKKFSLAIDREIERQLEEVRKK